MLAEELDDRGRREPAREEPLDAVGDRLLVRLLLLDLALLLGNWGLSGTGDIDGDGTIGGADLTLLLSAWSC